MWAFSGNIFGYLPFEGHYIGSLEESLEGVLLTLYICARAQGLGGAPRGLAKFDYLAKRIVMMGF